MFSFHYLRLRTAHFYRSRPEKRQVYKSHPIKKREKKNNVETQHTTRHDTKSK